MSKFTPSVPSTALNPGTLVKISTSRGEEFSGKVFTHDVAAELLIVEKTYDFDDERNYNNRADNSAAETAVNGEGKRDFTMLQTKQIRVEVLEESATESRSLPPLSVPAINSKAEENLFQRRDEASTIGIGVSAEAQKLFDAIRKTTPCVWSPDFNSFIVMDTVQVSSPFTSAACTSVLSNSSNNKKNQAVTAAAETMLTRVKKLVDGERAKLKLKP